MAANSWHVNGSLEKVASGQLGHSSPAIAREFYISKPAIAADVAHVPEALARPEGD